MAVSWVSSTAHAGNPTTSATVTLPTTAADDILIVTVNNGGANAALTLTTGTFSLDTSLALIGSGGGWTTGWGGTYWVRCSGNHSGETIIATGATDSCSMLVQRFSGCATTGNPYDTNISEATVGSGANCALAAFNTTLPNTLVVYTVSRDDNIAATTPTKGGVAMGNLTDATSTGGADSGSAMASLAQSGTGTTGAFSMTFAAGTNTGKRATAFALKEPPPLVLGGVASEADAALAATVSQPQAPVSGGVASEADSGPVATVSQPQAPVAGGVASEADSAPAATVDQGSGVFSPDDIASLACWLKADAISANDGDNITTWEDSHTSNKDATSATGQTLQTGEMNGLPVVRFDGTDDTMSIAGITNNDSSRTIFMVWRTITVVALDCPFGWGTSACFRGGNAGAGDGGWNSNEANAFVSFGALGAVGTVEQVTLRINSTTSADGWLTGNGPTNFDPNPAVHNGTAALNIGSRSAANFINADVAECLVFDAALTDTEVADVQAYLAEKWLAQTINAGVATEADSVPAATVSQPQAPVAGGVASEADSAPAATVDQGSGAFSPDDIASLACWLKADAIGGADGDPVTTWEDSHTSNKDATGASGQTLETNEINGLPAVRFDGTDDQMSITGILNNTAARTVFCVARYDTGIASSDTTWSLLSSSARIAVSGGNIVYQLNQANATVALAAQPAVGEAHHTTIRFNSTSSADGWYNTTGPTNFDPNDNYQNGTTAMKLGATTGGGANFFDGYIAELLVFDAALTDTEVADVQAYLDEKWINAPQTISGGVASEADSVPAATVSQPQTPVSGGVASEADSGPAATKIQPQAPVSGGVASEADSANAATVSQPQAPVAGGVATESDSAPAATVSQPQAPVSGGVASEADSANAATVSQPQAPVAGGVASEADSAPAATVDQASGDQTIFAGVASETDSVPAGTPTGGAQPPDTNPELGGVVSEPTLGGVFDESVTGGTFVEPSHGGNVTEPTLGGVFDETTTGGEVTEPDEGAEIDNFLGGVIDEVLTNGSVTEPSINGSVTEPALNGAVTEPDLGALLDEAVRSSQIDEATRSGTPDESNRGGTIDEVLTGGEIF
jgi:hypothetical protein